MFAANDRNCRRDYANDGEPSATAIRFAVARAQTRRPSRRQKTRKRLSRVRPASQRRHLRKHLGKKPCRGTDKGPVPRRLALASFDSSIPANRRTGHSLQPHCIDRRRIDRRRIDRSGIVLRGMARHRINHYYTTSGKQRLRRSTSGKQRV